ncbi:MAG: hypothetical protein KGJ88_11735 [Verrucomicrobiota bacterium]|nr:hypothetical protein [Verrucomicrobiota bacterium]
MKKRTVTKIIILAVGTVAVSILTGCSTAPMVSNRVGPAPVGRTGSNSAGEGWLVVRTATATYEVGDRTYYHPHTGYSIYAESGKLWKYVPNNTGETDETAALVRIPAGNYNVHADSDFGPVIVPVLIVADQTTEVNLDTSGEKHSRSNNDTAVVWLPSGRSSAYYQIGWRAP